MTTQTKQKIAENVIHRFSTGGESNVSVREIAKDIGIAPSVVYHHYENKEQLLEEVFTNLRKELGKRRNKLQKTNSTKEMLKQRIMFQFDNATEVIFILKYYTSHRKNFERNPQGFVPTQAYKHIKEVLEYGVSTGEFLNKEIDIQAKIITHAINGFVLEYYPDIPTQKEKEKMANEISNFVYKAIEKGGVKNGRK